jgi:hypothetical protein
MSFTDTIEQVAMALSDPALWKESALKRSIYSLGYRWGLRYFFAGFSTECQDRRPSRPRPLQEFDSNISGLQQMSFTDTIEQVAMALSDPALWKESALKRSISEKEGLIKYGVSLSLGTKVDWQRRVCGLNLGEYNE